MLGYETCAVSGWAEITIPLLGLPAGLATKLIALGTLRAAPVKTKDGKDARLLELPVVRYRSSWAVNAIPTASLSLALGRYTDSLNASETHALQDILRAGLEVKVYLRVKQELDASGLLSLVGSGAVLKPWSGESFLAFEGVSSAAAQYQRTAQGVSYDLGVVHWLEALSRSSTVSAMTHTRSVNVLGNLPAVSSASGGPITSTPLSLRAFLPISHAQDFILASTSYTDLWGPGRKQGILAWLRRECEKDDVLQFTAIASSLSRDIDFNPGARGLSNTAALSALARFEPLDGVGYVDGVPLALTPIGLGPSADSFLANIISESLSRTSLSQLAGSTTWDLLMALGQAFFFAVVPLVETALVVPFVKGLRQPLRTIFGHEYGGIGNVMSHEPKLRGVLVIGNPETATRVGAITGAPSPAPPPTTSQAVGWYQGANEGQILFTGLPSWAASFRWPGSGRLTSGAGGIRGTAFSPGAVAAGAAAFLGPLPEVRTAVQQHFADRLAHSIYVNEVLGQRQAEITSKLRFDIAPGTVVAVEGVPEEFLAASDSLAAECVGTVLQAEYVVDVQTPAAIVTYRIGNLRTKVENTLDACSVESHPLWRNSWHGCKLVKRT